MNHQNFTPDAVLLVGHGTRNPTGHGQFLRLASLTRAALGPLPLSVAFIELQQPTIEAALSKLASQGHTRILLSPALLFAAGHAKRDIPAAIARARGLHPQLEVVIAEPLGLHPQLLELAARRFQGAKTTPGRVHPALVLVGRGSSDPEAIEHCREFAVELGKQFAAPSIFTGFLAIAQPQLDEALNQAASSGREQIVVQPHLLFAGEMLESTLIAVERARELHPRIAWHSASHLGADLLDSDSIAGPLLVAALLARIEAACSTARSRARPDI